MTIDSADPHSGEGRHFLGRAERWLTLMALRFPFHLAGTLGLITLVSGWISGTLVGAEPPDYFARTIDDGNVTFVFYDPIREPRTHRGYATFRLDVSYRSNYQYKWMDLARGRQVTIKPKIGPITYKLVNEVQLPESLNHDRRWANSLVRHEFDHVAMTLDPRVRMLIEDLCEGTPDIIRTLPVGATLADEYLDGLVHEAVGPRYQSVLKVLIANEHDFDVHTRHGVRDLPDRRAYFGDLFTEPNLKQQRFPFLEEVKPLLRKKSYREAKLPYRLGN